MIATVEKVNHFLRWRLTLYVAELFKKRLIRRDNHTFKGDGFLRFLERGVGAFNDGLPLTRKSAVRFFVIVVKSRSRVVDIFVAVMSACPFRLTADFTERAFAKFFYSNILIAYNVFLLNFYFITYTGGVVWIYLYPYLTRLRVARSPLQGAFF